MNPLRGFFAHFSAYHSHGRPIIQYSGMIGMVAFPLFYLLRFTKADVPFNDAGLRVIAMLLCAGLALRGQWPQWLRRYFFAYAYVTFIYCMPFFFVFTSLVNGGGTVGVANTLMAAFFLVLLSDWRNSVVMLVVGCGMAVGLYMAVTPDPQFPRDYIGRLPILVLVVVGGSAFKLAQKQAEAEKIKRTYTAMAGSIAHEMRNPLSQIRHSLDSMQRALPLPTTEMQAQTISGVEVDALYRHLAQSAMAVKRGLQVISMTLDEVNEKPIDASAFSYISAAEATDKAVREYGYEDDADRARVRMQVLEDFNFRGGETAYLFVLFNLMRNALYYAALNARGLVTVTVKRQQVVVHDNGPGIAPDLLARLFEPFASSGKSGGTGLGLVYCRRVMTAFGGRIECETVLGQYTQFTLHFPEVTATETEAHWMAVLARAREVLAGKRILVVDDDAAQRLTTRHKLLPLTAAIDEAPDGQRAVEMLSRERYDLVLLDLNMPLLDGYAVARKLRHGQIPASRGARIVAYTSEPAHLASVKTHKAGMDGFISKPCTQLQLVQSLQYVMEHQPAAVAPGAEHLAGRRILVADDSPVNRKAVTAWLRHAGAAVSEVAHGQAVLDRLGQGGQWDAVVMDVRMPGMSGLDAARAIRASGQPWNGLPIVALTAGSGAQAMEAARSAGFDRFLTKPLEVDALYDALGDLIGGRPPGAATAPLAEEATEAGPLLDLQRLEGYRRIGMLEELLGDYVAELGRLADSLHESVARQDLRASIETMHSLLGISGEAGAGALYRLVRRLYVPMVEEHSLPSVPGWEAQVHALAQQTQAALRAYGTQPSPVQTG
ncbi:MAG: response regulator [Ramlibacter sp.]